MAELTVQIKTRMYNSYYSGERYGDWSEDSSYEGCSVYLSEQGGRVSHHTKRFGVSFEPVPGQVVFPVVVVYSSGNSFGRSTGEVALVGVYDNPEKARKIADAIQENSALGRSGGQQYCINVEGEEIYCGAWVGYFEYLESVHVETEMVKA